MCRVCGACQRCARELGTELRDPSAAQPRPEREPKPKPKPPPVSLPFPPREPLDITGALRRAGSRWLAAVGGPAGLGCLIAPVGVIGLGILAVANDWAGTVGRWMHPIAPFFNPLAVAIRDVDQALIAIALAAIGSVLYYWRSNEPTRGHGASVHGRTMKMNPRSETAWGLFIFQSLGWLMLLSTLGLGKPLP